MELKNEDIGGQDKVIRYYLFKSLFSLYLAPCLLMGSTTRETCDGICVVNNISKWGGDKHTEFLDGRKLQKQPYVLAPQLTLQDGFLFLFFYSN